MPLATLFIVLPLRPEAGSQLGDFVPSVVEKIKEVLSTVFERSTRTISLCLKGGPRKFHCLPLLLRVAVPRRVLAAEAGGHGSDDAEPVSDRMSVFLCSCLEAWGCYST